jgi:hypothetical protein
MNPSNPTIDLAKHIAEIKTSWALAAFAIAVLALLSNAFRTKPNSAMRKTTLVIAGIVCFLAVVPMITDAFLKSRRLDVESIYRVRVTVVDSENVPVDGASVRVTAASEAKTAPDGSAELAIPRGSLPQDGKVVVYADKNAAFLHGHKNMSMAADPNPSVTVTVIANRTAEVKGVVQDNLGRVIAGARVSVLGGNAITTDADGRFRLPAQASSGQKVLLHVEKPGYVPQNQYHPAGEPLILVLAPFRMTP